MKALITNNFKIIQFSFNSFYLIKPITIRKFNEFPNEKDYKINPNNIPVKKDKPSKTQEKSASNSSELSGSDSSTTESLWESEEEIIPMIPKSLDEDFVFF